MRINEPRAAIYNALSANAELVDMLAENTLWSDRRLAPSKAYSIVPMDKIDGLKPLFIGIMAGQTTLTAEFTHDVFFYIRCYNNRDKTYVDIDNALSLVYDSLHRKKLPMVGAVNVKTYHETTLDEMVDEANNMRYRESRYRLVVL